MEILVRIQNGKIKVLLLENGKILDFLSLPEEMRLSEKLLPAMDKLLKRNKLKPGDAKQARVDSDQGDSSTTTRIARAVANAWNYAARH